MGNTKLYAFDGDLKDGKTLTAEDLESASRGYATLRVEPDGYLGQGKPWAMGAIHSHSLSATERLRELLGDRLEDYVLVLVDQDQVDFGGGLHLGTRKQLWEYGEKLVAPGSKPEEPGR